MDRDFKGDAQVRPLESEVGREGRELAQHVTSHFPTSAAPHLLHDGGCIIGEGSKSLGTPPSPQTLPHTYCTLVLALVITKYIATYRMDVLPYRDSRSSTSMRGNLWGCGVEYEGCGGKKCGRTQSASHMCHTSAHVVKL